MQTSKNVVEAVWNKARQIPDKDPGEWRKDSCGAWLHRHQYNNIDSEYGWKIENTVAGGRRFEDLQPFHWRNGFDNLNGQPRCRVNADPYRNTSGPDGEVPRNLGV
jgi:hypothetical protein